MTKMQSTLGSQVVCHGGERFDPDVDGVFDVPYELAKILISHGFVEVDAFPIRRGRPRKNVEPLVDSIEMVD